MAEATSQVVLGVFNSTNRNKLVVLKVSPQATTDLITFDQSTLGKSIGQNFNKVLAAHAYDSSTGMPKAISSDGSTILTTVGWTLGDNAWFVWATLLNDTGAGV